jgi:hypothetical protein
MRRDVGKKTLDLTPCFLPFQISPVSVIRKIMQEIERTNDILQR